MSVYLGKNKVGITKYEDLDTELAEQEELLNTLEEDVNALSDKPTDMLQAIVDATNSCDNLFSRTVIKNLDLIKNLDTSRVTNMYEMFYSCQQLLSVDLSNLNTEQVTSMSSMFSYCTKLETLDLSSFNTSNVTGMSNMFSNCKALNSLDLSNFDTSKVTEMNAMFDSCEKLETLNISSFNTSKVTTMSNMFRSCKKLEHIDLSHFDTSKVQAFDYMFAYCDVLDNLDLSSFDTSNALRFGYMFINCKVLKDINLSSFDTSNGTQFEYMFAGCYELETITNLNFINATAVNNPFQHCRKLANLTIKNIKKSLKIGESTSYGTLLTNESLINTVQELWDLTGSTSQTLTMSTTSKENIANIYVKLVDVTEEMLAQDEYAGNKKPCVVCEPTDDGAMTLTEYAISKNWAIA